MKYIKDRNQFLLKEDLSDPEGAPKGEGSTETVVDVDKKPFIFDSQVQLFESVSDDIANLPTDTWDFKFNSISNQEYQDILNKSDVFEKDKLYPKSEDDRTQNIGKYWGFHASDYGVFGVINSIYKILKKNGIKKPKIIDIGCGIGNIVRVSNMIGLDSYGIEINKDLKKFHTGIKVEYGNIFSKLDLLKDKDIIYLYQPFRDENMEIKFMNKIYNHTKEDVVVIYNHYNLEHQKWSLVNVIDGHHSIGIFMK